MPINDEFDNLPDLSALEIKPSKRAAARGDESVARVVDDELGKLGWSDNARLSFLGDLGRENGWNRGIIFGGHIDPASNKNGRGTIKNRGIISWNGDRRTNLDNYLAKQGLLGKNDDDELRAMVRFADEEMRGSKEWRGVHQAMRRGDISTYDASEQLRKYIKYSPDAPYNTPDDQFRTKNNRKWAERAKNLGLAQLPDLSTLEINDDLPDLSALEIKDFPAKSSALPAQNPQQPQTSVTPAGSVSSDLVPQTRLPANGQNNIVGTNPQTGLPELSSKAFENLELPRQDGGNQPPSLPPSLLAETPNAPTASKQPLTLAPVAEPTLADAFPEPNPNAPQYTIGDTGRFGAPTPTPPRFRNQKVVPLGKRPGATIPSRNAPQTSAFNETEVRQLLQERDPNNEYTESIIAAMKASPNDARAMLAELGKPQDDADAAVRGKSDFELGAVNADEIDENGEILPEARQRSLTVLGEVADDQVFRAKVDMRVAPKGMSKGEYALREGLNQIAPQFGLSPADVDQEVEDRRRAGKPFSYRDRSTQEADDDEIDGLTARNQGYLPYNITARQIRRMLARRGDNDKITQEKADRARLSEQNKKDAESTEGQLERALNFSFNTALDVATGAPLRNLVTGAQSPKLQTAEEFAAAKNKQAFGDSGLLSGAATENIRNTRDWNENKTGIDRAVSLANSTVQGFTDTFAGLPESVAIAQAAAGRTLGYDISADETVAYQIGDAMRKSFEKSFRVNPAASQGFVNSLVTNSFRGIGNVAGTILLTAATGGAGGTSATMARLAGGAIEGGQVASEAYRAAKKKGATEDEALLTSILAGGAGAAVGGLSEARLFKQLQGVQRLNRATNGTFAPTFLASMREIIARRGKEFVKEGGVEFFEESVQNAAAKIAAMAVYEDQGLSEQGVRQAIVDSFSESLSAFFVGGVPGTITGALSPEADGDEPTNAQIAAYKKLERDERKRDAEFIKQVDARVTLEDKQFARNQRKENAGLQTIGANKLIDGTPQGAPLENETPEIEQNQAAPEQPETTSEPKTEKPFTHIDPRTGNKVIVTENADGTINLESESGKKFPRLSKTTLDDLTPIDQPQQTAEPAQSQAEANEAAAPPGMGANLDAETATPLDEREAAEAKKLAGNEASSKPTDSQKPPREFASSQVDLSEQDAAEVLSLGKNLIADADLSEDGREDKPHITVKFGLHDDADADLRETLAGEKPITVTLGKTSIFSTNPDFDVVKVDVDSPELRALNSKIAENHEHTDTHPEYNPHVTLAYVKKGAGKKYIGDNSLEGKQITFNSVTFSGKDRTKTAIELNGQNVQEPAPNIVDSAENTVNTGKTDVQKSIENVPDVQNLPQSKENEKKAKVIADTSFADNKNKQIVYTERGTKAEVAPIVVEADDLITSLEDAYPSEFQPRDRSRKSSVTQVDSIAQNLNPEFLSDSAKASDGRPLVVPVSIDGQTKYAVISGNGRTAAIKQAYKNGNPASKSYRQFATGKAENDKLKNPVYVAVLDSQAINLESFAREANEQSVQAMSATEQAIEDAKTLTNSDLISQFVPADDGSIHAAANRDFVRGFVGQVIAQSEQNRFVDENFNLSQDGERRVRNAIFAAAFGDSEAGLSAITRLAELTDNNIRNITNGLLKTAGKFAAFKSLIKSGARHAELDITNDIAAGVEKFANLRANNQSVAEYLAQQNLFGDDLTPFQKRIVTFFDANKRSGKAVAGVFDNYLIAANGFGDPRQSNLFGGIKTPESASIFKGAVEEYESGKTTESENSASQTSLFDQDQGRENQRTSSQDSQNVNSQNQENQSQVTTPALNETERSESEVTPDAARKPETSAEKSISEQAKEASEAKNFDLPAQITVDGKTAKVLKAVYGKVKVEFADGTTKLINRSDVETDDDDSPYFAKFNPQLAKSSDDYVDIRNKKQAKFYQVEPGNVIAPTEDETNAAEIRFKTSQILKQGGLFEPVVLIAAGLRNFEQTFEIVGNSAGYYAAVAARKVSPAIETFSGIVVPADFQAAALVQMTLTKNDSRPPGSVKLIEQKINKVDLTVITAKNEISAAAAQNVERLARAIVEVGQIVKPIILKQSGATAFGLQYELVAGGLMFAAAKRAAEIAPDKFETVPALIVTGDAGKSAPTLSDQTKSRDTETDYQPTRAQIKQQKMLLERARISKEKGDARAAQRYSELADYAVQPVPVKQDGAPLSAETRDASPEGVKWRKKNTEDFGGSFSLTKRGASFTILRKYLKERKARNAGKLAASQDAALGKLLLDLSNLASSNITNEELLEEATLTFNGKVAFANADAIELLRRANEIAFGRSTAVFYGVYLNPTHLDKVAFALMEMRMNLADTQSKRAMTNLLNVIRDPRHTNGLPIVAASKELPESVGIAVQEELAHQADVTLRGKVSARSVLRLSSARKAARVVKRTYQGSNEVIAKEVIAKAFRDDAETELELTTNEVDQIQRDYVKSLIANGIDRDTIADAFENVSKRGKEFAKNVRTDGGLAGSAGKTQPDGEDVVPPQIRGGGKVRQSNQSQQTNQTTRLESGGGTLDGRISQTSGSDAGLTAPDHFKDLTSQERRLINRRFGENSELAAQAAEEILFARPTAKGATSDFAKHYDFIKRGAVEIVGIPKSLKSSVDLSAAMRQGAVLTLTEPRFAKAAFWQQLKSGVSKKSHEKFVDDLISHESIELASESGLYLSNLVDPNDLNNREEAFISRLLGDDDYFKNKFAEGVRRFATWHVRASERAYTAYLDSIRLATFTKLSNELSEFNARTGRNDNVGLDLFGKRGFAGEKGQGRNESLEQYIALANFINVATGRGDLGKLDEVAAELNVAFFSARYLVSRFQLVNPVFYAKLPPRVRKIAVRKMVGFVGASAAIMALLALAGGQIEMDEPDDPDFLKVKFGDFRYDFGAGIIQPLRYLLRMAKSTTGKTPVADAGRLTLQFLRSKLAPTPAGVINLIEGKNMVGEETNLARESLNLITPLSAGDIAKAVREEGLIGAAKIAPAIVGVGIQNYDEAKKKKKRKKKND